MWVGVRTDRIGWVLTWLAGKRGGLSFVACYSSGCVFVGSGIWQACIINACSSACVRVRVRVCGWGERREGEGERTSMFIVGRRKRGGRGRE